MTAESERVKYEAAWNLEQYRVYAPGQGFVGLFTEMAAPNRGDRLIDFGTGTGKAALELQENGLDVLPVDIAENCLDQNVREKLSRDLLVTNLWEPLDIPRAPYGFCTDVMEHIPPEHVQGVLNNIQQLTRFGFFSICFEKDHFGKEVGEELHLTVKPFSWWRGELRKYGRVLEARDLIGEGVFYVQFGS